MEPTQHVHPWGPHPCFVPHALKDSNDPVEGADQADASPTPPHWSRVTGPGAPPPRVAAGSPPSWLPTQCVCGLDIPPLWAADGGFGKVEQCELLLARESGQGVEGGAQDPPLRASPHRGPEAEPQAWVGARPSGSEPRGHGRWEGMPLLGSSWSRDQRVAGCVTPCPDLPLRARRRLQPLPGAWPSLWSLWEAGPGRGAIVWSEPAVLQVSHSALEAGRQPVPAATGASARRHGEATWWAGTGPLCPTSVPFHPGRDHPKSPTRLVLSVGGAALPPGHVSTPDSHPKPRGRMSRPVGPGRWD